MKDHFSILPAWLDNPVLLYGARKSGTTMLRNLHDGSEYLFCLPTDLKIKYFLRTLWKEQPHAAKTYYSLSTVFDRNFPGFDKIAYRRYALEVERQPIGSLRDIICRDVYSFYSCLEERPTNVTMWVMKEVGGNTDLVLSAFRQMFFQGKIVSILRNPLNITRSVLLNRKRRGKRLSSKDIFKQVYEPIRVLYHQSRLIKDNSIHFVAYEFITGGFLKDEMAGICRYLGLPYSPSFERTTIFTKPVITSTSSKQSTHVFQNSTRWYDGLSFKERLTVLCFYSSISRYFRSKYLWRKTYSEILQEVAEKRNRLLSA